MTEYGLIGAKLPHSYSPEIHAAIHGKPYELKEFTPEEAEEFIRSKKFKGMNVTLPYKKLAYSLADELGKNAKRVGSVNTLLVREDGTLFADNTDYPGLAALLDKLGADVKGKRVLVLGSGGASLAAIAVAEDRGAREVSVVSRTGALNYKNIYDVTDAEVLINATPVGMYPNVDDCPVDIARLECVKYVADMIYNPINTCLVLEARAAGKAAEGGMYMLVAQATRSASIWLGEDLTQLDEKVYKAICAAKGNIVLTGMPGSGKTSVGEALAEALSKEFVDTDAMVVENAGKSIPEIFEEGGEELFRSYERAAVAEAAKRGGRVIATGGGVILNELNMRRLKQNGRVYLIKRDRSLLATDGRPLSKNLDKMEEVRGPLYAKYADAAMMNDGALDETVNAILEDYNENTCDKRA